MKVKDVTNKFTIFPDTYTL